MVYILRMYLPHTCVSYLNFSGCGYSNEARQQRENKLRAKKGETVKDKPSTRFAPFDYTGCMAHADITFAPGSSDRITRLVGYLEHNEACQHAFIRRVPAVPLHAHVVEIALAQLSEGARYVQALLRLLHNADSLL